MGGDFSYNRVGGLFWGGLFFAICTIYYHTIRMIVLLRSAAINLEFLATNALIEFIIRWGLN